MKILLKLYPAPWRRRYEDEVAAYLDEAGSPPVRTAIDLIAGALDARLNPATTPTISTNGDAQMIIESCRCDSLDIPKRDVLISSAWMIGLSLLLAGTAVYLDQEFGDHIAIKALLYSAFFIAYTITARWTYLRPYTSRARNTIIAVAVPMWYLFFLVLLLVGQRF